VMIGQRGDQTNVLALGHENLVPAEPCGVKARTIFNSGLRFRPHGQCEPAHCTRRRIGGDIAVNRFYACAL
jgi:hypothetical protein